MACAFLFAAFLAGAAPGCADVPDSPPDALSIFILAGQSNMVGRGDLADLPVGFNQPDDQIWLFGNDDLWKPALEPLDDARNQVDLISADYSAGAGPGLAFAKELRSLRPVMKIGLVPCALSGSMIDQWLVQGKAETLYGSCIRRARAAASRGRVAGLLWYQGESDTQTPEMIRQWPGKFKLLVKRFRTDLAKPELPVVFVQIGDLGPRFRNERFQTLWKAMHKIQARTSVAHGAMVSARGLRLMPDGVHLSSEAGIALGRKMAVAMNDLLLDLRD